MKIHGKITMSLKSLREVCAMAQFSEAEIPAHVLNVVKQSGTIPGERIVEINPQEAHLVMSDDEKYGIPF